MIANDKQSPLEVAVKMITAPVWVPIYFAYVGCRKAAEAWSRHKPKEPTTEILPPAPTWMPTRDIERGLCRVDPRWRARQQPPLGGVDGLFPR